MILIEKDSDKMIINNTLIFEENALQVFAEKIDCTITIILKYHGTIIYTNHFFYK